MGQFPRMNSVATLQYPDVLQCSSYSNRHQARPQFGYSTLATVTRLATVPGPTLFPWAVTVLALFRMLLLARYSEPELDPMLGRALVYHRSLLTSCYCLSRVSTSLEDCTVMYHLM